MAGKQTKMKENPMKADNVKDMREALKMFVDAYSTTSYSLCLVNLRPAFQKAKAALAAPLRNCDVGTASQQAQRFAELCTSHSKDGARGICDEKCPFYGKEYVSDCAIHWAQMPYERGIEE